MKTVNGVLKRTGSSMLALLIVLAAGMPLFSASIDVELDRNRIGIGETTALKVKIADAAEIEPVTIPSVPGLEITYAGMGRSIEVVNWKKSVSSVFTFYVTGMKKGSYTIPAFTFKVDGTDQKTRPVSLYVLKGSPALQQQQRGDEDGPSSSGMMQMLFEISSEKVYIGEPVLIRYYILATPGVQYKFEGFEKTPETRGFVSKDFDETIAPEEVTVKGVNYVKEHIKTFVLIPTAKGTYTTGAVSGIISIRDRRNFFPFPSQRRIFFDSIDIQVMSLPAVKVPPGFSGSVGDFKLEARYTPDPIQIYGEKKIVLTVTGEGNLITLDKPALTGGTEKVKVISEDGTSSYDLEKEILRGSREFIYTVIPEQAGSIKLGNFSLTFFNPRTKQFDTITSEEIIIHSQGEEKSGSRIDFDKDETKIDFNPLIIVMIVLVIAVLVVVIMIWERRRYRLVSDEKKAEKKKAFVPKEEPGVDHVVGMLQAMEKGDASGFCKSAEKALNGLNANDLSADDVEEVNRCRELIYKAQFGGGNISEKDMAYITGIIKKLT